MLKKYFPPKNDVFPLKWTLSLSFYLECLSDKKILIVINLVGIQKRNSRSLEKKRSVAGGRWMVGEKLVGRKISSEVKLEVEKLAGGRWPVKRSVLAFSTYGY